MKIPVSSHKDLLTGETTYEYAEITERQFAEFFIGLYNRTNPNANITLTPEPDAIRS